MTAQETGLILEMQNEPQLNAGIRNGESDSVCVGFLDRLSHLHVSVDVEYAPDLVVCAAAAAPLVASLQLFRINSPVDERVRHSVERIDGQNGNYPLTV